MKTKFHIEITQKALNSYFSEEAIDVIVSANIRQDRIIYQFKHDYIHFDGSAFKEGFEYIEFQEKRIIENLRINQVLEARKSLGYILHSWQDFYSHSNYIPLWLASNNFKPPEHVEWDDQSILENNNLKSGKNYGVIEFLAMIPGLSKIIMPLIPEDSHTRMNIDSPMISSNFNYVYVAALMRSENVIIKLLERMKKENISHKNLAGFFGQ